MDLKSVILSSAFFFLSLTSAAADPVQTEPQIIDLTVNERGFFPNIIQADPGKPVILKVTRTTKETCATSMEIPSKKIKRKLPLNKLITIKVGSLERGEVKFGCVKNMAEGGIIYVK